MPVVLSGTNGVTFPDSSLQAAAASPYVLKNRIINGDMRIDQRYAGAINSSGGYNVDRFQCYQTQTSKFTAQQSTTAPTGFKNSVVITSTSAFTPAAGDYFSFTHRIEGYNVADFMFGTASASTFTVSFWVRSSLTGTFGGALHNNAFNRVYAFSYTINAANTWEQKTVTIAGDTTGTWTTDNSVGLEIGFAFSVGSSGLATAGSWSGTSNIFSATGQTNLLGTNGATFYITGVQLEQGSTATPFERRLYGQELANCQRYFISYGGDTTNQNFFITQAVSATQFNGGVLPFPVKMRTTPTFSYSALSDFYSQNSIGGAATPTAITQNGGEESTMCGVIGGIVASGLSAGNASLFFAQTANARLRFSAEL
jgi:hypothetical protein